MIKIVRISFFATFMLLLIAAMVVAEKISAESKGYKNIADWRVINEWGNGSKTYVDKSSIKKEDIKTRVWVKYYMEPPGKDKLNNKDVREMMMLEEYDCKQKQFRIHRIIFKYVDSTTGEPVSPEPSWAPATGGNQITLNYICQIK